MCSNRKNVHVHQFWRNKFIVNLFFKILRVAYCQKLEHHSHFAKFTLPLWIRSVYDFVHLSVQQVKNDLCVSGPKGLVICKRMSSTTENGFVLMSYKSVKEWLSFASRGLVPCVSILYVVKLREMPGIFCTGIKTILLGNLQRHKINIPMQWTPFKPHLYRKVGCTGV